MSQLTPQHPCTTCARLPELLAQAESLQAHDARLEALLNEVEGLLGPAASPVPAPDKHECDSHLPLLQALIPRLQRIYETLLVERQQLNKSITDLDVLRTWSQQWTSGAAQSHHTIIA